MKNLLKLVLLVGLFISSSSDVFSQSIINNTDCNFRVKVYFSYPADCDNSDDMNYNAPAMNTTAITPPAGSRVTGAKGRPLFFSTSPSGCDFVVTVCAGGPTFVTVPCPTSNCDNYTVSIDANTGNITINP